MTYGNGVFVAVGQGGSVMRSADGITWTASESGTTRYLSAVHFAEGQFVAAGQRGKIISSSDGIAWQSGNIPVGYWLNTVTRGNGVWVVAGFEGTVYSSADLLTCTAETTGSGTDYFGSCEGGGNMLLVDLPSAGTGVIARSSTPIVEDPPPAAPQLAMGSITGTGNTVMYALPADGPQWDSISVFVSDDLQTWDPLPNAPVLISSDSEGDHYEVIDSAASALDAERYYRADFTLLGS